MPSASVGELEQLKQFVTTPTQLAKIDLTIECGGNAHEAARRMGISPSSILHALGVVRKFAASQGLAPAYGWQKPVPEPMRLKGNSDHYEKGKLTKQWVKSERGPSGKPKVDPLPPNFSLERVSTMYGRQGEVLIQHQRAVADKNQKNLEEFWRQAKQHAKQYRGLSKPSKPMPMKRLDLLSTYVLGDPHIGMLAWGRETGGRDFDLKIAQEQLYRCVEMLVEMAPPAKEAFIVDVGDFFHADDDNQLTPRGHNKVDVDSRQGKVIRVGLDLFRRLIDLCKQKHELVTVDIRRGNHDPKLSTVLQMLLLEMYRNDDRVVIEENLNPFAYKLFGKNLIGTCHGDETRPEQLPGVMATDCGPNGIPGCRSYWGKANYKVWILGHIHHKKVVKVEEYPDVKMEYFNTLAPRDAWHNGAAYRSSQYLQVISFDREYGECHRATVDARRVDAYIEQRLKGAKERKR